LGAREGRWLREGRAGVGLDWVEDGPSSWAGTGGDGASSKGLARIVVGTRANLARGFGFRRGWGELESAKGEEEAGESKGEEAGSSAPSKGEGGAKGDATVVGDGAVE